LAQLACGIFQISDSLGRDIWNTSELLACFFNKLGGGVDFLCGDLAQCQLGNQCRQSVDSSFFHQEAWDKTSADDVWIWRARFWSRLLLK